MKKMQSGFTLIELLVVIAIIGILAALVLVALGNARDKANDAKVKSDVSQLRTLAEVLYDSSGASYAAVTTCFNSTVSTVNCAGDANLANSVTTLRADVVSASGGSVAAGSTASGFCVSAGLKTDTTKFACMDSTGVYKQSTAACGAAATACP